MTMEGPRLSKLTKLVANHILGHEHRDELLALVNRKRNTYHLGNDRGPTRPGLDDLLALGLYRVEHLHHQMLVNEWSLFNRTSHRLLTLCATATDDELIGRLVLPGLVSLRRHTPG